MAGHFAAGVDAVKTRASSMDGVNVVTWQDAAYL